MVIGPIPWGHSGPLSPLSRVVVVVVFVVVVDIDAQAARDSTASDICWMGVRLAVVNGPNIFQMLLVLIFTIFGTWIMLAVANSIIKFNHHTWAAVYLWWCCDAGLLMPFSVNDKHLIKVLWEEKQYTALEFIREFPNKKWSRGGLNHLLEKYRQICLCWPPCRYSGRPQWRSTHNAENIESVHSDKDRPHSHRSVRQIAREAHNYFSLVCT